MTRLLAILAVIALLVAACGLDDATETTAVEPPGSWPSCFVAPGYPDDKACANLDPEEAEETGQEAASSDHTGGFLIPERADGPGHFCLAQENHVFVRPVEDFNPADFGVVPVDPDELFFSGEAGNEIEAEEAGDVLVFYQERSLGLFRIEDGSELLAKIDEIQRADFEASPHYVLAPAPTWKYGPHTTVRRLANWDWDQLPITGSDVDGRRVVIIDTGSVGDPDSAIGIGMTEPEGAVPASVVGHGVFAASIVKQFNPSLSVDLYRAGFLDGTLTEASVTAALIRANPMEKDVVNLSLGTYQCADEYAPLGLAVALSNLPKTVHIVAASGNDAESEPDHQTLFPASLGMGGGPMASQVTAVGALDVEGQRAAWSNPAEVEAPGENLVGWYHDGNGGGLAVWSGTSFAAPHFAACIASGQCQAP